MEHAFGSAAPFSLGVEEELFLVDPVTGRQVNSAEAVLARLGEVPEGTVERELHACQVELITEIHTHAGEAARAIGRLRAAVRETGAGILGAGTHPSGEEGEAEITDKERYERIHSLLGDAVITPVSGLHVHVGMPDPETAIRVFNGLRDHLPLLQALSANSPLRHGRDSGLASAREVTLRGWPRSGVPRAFSDFADFSASSEAVARAAEVPDYTWFWWKLRPHPRLGTVEIRALDAQTTLEELAGLVALVHCLARGLADRAPHTGLPDEILAESIFRSARWGVGAELIDTDGRPRPVRDLLAAVLDDLADCAGALDCTAELATLESLVADGGGAERQRRVYAIAGIDALTRDLAERTAAHTQGG